MSARLATPAWPGLFLLLAAAGCASLMGSLRSPEIGREGVMLRYRAPSALVVQVAGTWQTNDNLRGREWTSDEIVGQMALDTKTGVWELTLNLQPGRYEYLFRVDGRFWELDPLNPERARDAQGGFVSLLVVP